MSLDPGRLRACSYQMVPLVMAWLCWSVRSQPRQCQVWQTVSYQFIHYLFILCQPADFEARRRLRSASSSSLVVRRTRLSTVGDRAFPVAAARIWNGLPPHVTSAPSLPVFCSRLKTHLFRRCFPWLRLLFFVVPVKWLVIIGHINRSFYLLTYSWCHVTTHVQTNWTHWNSVCSNCMWHHTTNQLHKLNVSL